MATTGYRERGRSRGPRGNCRAYAQGGRIGALPSGLGHVAGLFVAVALASCSNSGSPTDVDGEPVGGGDVGVSTGPYDPGTRMADVELAAPSQAEFFLRATLPVPPNTFPREEDVDLFSFVSPAEEVFPAQTEIVTRYSVPEVGADVLEVIARVRAPEGTQPGDRLKYAIIWDPHLPTPLTLSPAVEELLGDAGSVTASTRDVFGHVYTADLLAKVRTSSPELRRFRDGNHLRQVRAHELLLAESPVTGSLGTLPHLMGIHSYVTFYDQEEFFALDLRVHNGASGLSPYTVLDDPLNDVYFDSFQLRLPEGWKVLVAFRDPYFGDPIPVGGRVAWPIVEPLSDDDLHLMTVQSQFERRLVIAKDDPETVARARVALNEEGLAFVRPAKGADPGEKWSWWNRDTARYFPQNLRFPDLSFLGEDHEVRAALAQRYEAHLEALVDGTTGPWPIVEEVMGWCHPWGPAFGAMHGGSEIFLFDGLRTASSASLEGYRLHQLSQRMYTCRQDVTLYEADGTESRVENWVRTEPDSITYLPVWIFLVPYLFLGDPHGFGDAPTFQQEAVIAQGREPYYSALMHEYQPIDIQHLVRYTRSLKTLAWLGNDALAKDDLRMHAELMRFSYNHLPQTEGGSSIVTGMFSDIEFVASHLGEGLDVTRGEGWLTDTVVAAYRLADPEWRAEVYPWFGEIVQLFSDGQESCSGVIGSVPNHNWFDAQYRCRQSISAAILENGLWGVRTSVYADRDPAMLAQLDELLRKTFYAMISSTYWNDVEHAPYFLVATGPYNTDLPGFCGYVPSDGTMGSDSYQTWCSCAWGFRLTGDSGFLTRATEMAGGDLWSDLEQGGYGEQENRAALLLLWQEIHGY